jgi:hypothetical protein
MGDKSKFFVVVQFPDGSSKTHSCGSKGEAKRKFVQALRNPVVDRCGGIVFCEDENHKRVEVF